MQKLFLTGIVSLVLFAASCKKDKKALPKVSGSEALDIRYSVSGSMTDHHSNLFTGLYPHEITLEKVGTNQGRMVPKLIGIPGHLIASGINTTYYSNFGPVITIDLNTYKITSITNHYGQPSSNGRSATLDPSGENSWNPVTKEIRIKYWMDEPAAIMPHRASFNETWTYLGPK